MGFAKEFREFAIKGNVMDMAVGVIIGGAFGKIISSVIDDLVMPVVGAMVGKPDFSGMYLVMEGNVPDGTSLEEARKIAGTSILAYGNFITAALNFLLLALVVFMMVKAINGLKKKQEETPPPAADPSFTEVLLMEIRDALKGGKA